MLDKQEINPEDKAYQEKNLQDCLKMGHAFALAEDIHQSLCYLVSGMNRFFSAERGGIFWLETDQPDGFKLLAARNIADMEIRTDDFRTQMTLIKKVFKEERPLIKSWGSTKSDNKGVRKPAVLCLPIWKSDVIRGVLYFDNSYLNDCFDMFSNSRLLSLARQLSEKIGIIIEHSRILEESKRLPYSLSVSKEQTAVKIMVAKSPQLIGILDQADRVAKSDGTILILGETGVGKELFAKRIHETSRRCRQPFIIVDPTTIPENLVESELFGYEKGAFTGADSRKPGWIELAHKGTLFIDEIGEIPKSLQVKLLRVIQEKTFVRVGGSRSLVSDFRLVVATNRNLKKEVAEGRFRKDLYYRLNMIEITLPPLRDRKVDIVPIAEYFVKRFCKNLNRPDRKLSADEIEKLRAYSWPGNVRELQNVIERAVILSTGDRLELNLPHTKSLAEMDTPEDILDLDEVQRRHIRFVLSRTGGRIAGTGGAAELLGMKRTSLYSRMRSLGLK